MHSIENDKVREDWRQPQHLTGLSSLISLVAISIGKSALFMQLLYRIKTRELKPIFMDQVTPQCIKCARE